MSSFRSNVIISTIAMLLVGVTRPAFNAVMNHAFGPEINGRAATLISLVFVASLPATAALPTVMVRHLSRALGAGDRTEAAGHAVLASRATLILAALGAAAALVRGRLATVPPLDPLEGTLLVFGVVSYSFWRLHRTLLLAIGEVRASLRADMLSMAAFALMLGAVVALGAANLGVGAVFSVYALFVAVCLPIARRFGRGGRVDPSGFRSFVRYNVLWFVGTASSLAAREIALLLLDTRESKVAVGELSVALSLLTILAFAPRIIELPLVHELALLGGRADRSQQVHLTSKAMDWLTVLTLAGCFGAAILAGPILAFVGDVHTPEIVLAFVISTFAFSSEVVMTPAANLMVTEANPRLQAIVGAASLLAAYAYWYTPFCQGTLGIVVGLAISYAVKGVGFGGYARQAYGVSIWARPVRKTLVVALGGLLTVLVHRGDLNPWVGVAAFELALAVILWPAITEMVDSALKRRPATATGPAT